jgi:diguanylate cyclase (GGDEF)-like protein/PAS domain S-box-containing protein
MPHSCSARELPIYPAISMTLHPHATGGERDRHGALPVTRAAVVRALGDLQREDCEVGVIHLDLDRFHQVNSKFGHPFGDRALGLVTQALVQQLPDGALLAPVAGDAFVVVLPGAGAAECHTIAERLLQVVRTPFAIDDLTLALQASAGIAWRSPVDPVADLYESAFLACKRAKATAPGGVVAYAADLAVRADQRQRVMDGIRRALAQDELVLHFQPVVDLMSGDVIAVEALVRWQHPTDGLLGPGAFLPDAAATGLMVAVGDWVLDHAVAAVAALTAANGGTPLTVWVNLAAEQLADGERLCARVRDAIEANEIPPRGIGFEVTESSLLEDLPSAVDTLMSLRRLGVEIALDDFGTGYSSLTYLRQLPATAVKIDQRFVQGIGTKLADEAIIEAIIDLSHAMGLLVIGEGVEGILQATTLRRFGTDHAQGYYFSRPAPLEDIVHIVDLPWCGAEGPDSLRTDRPNADLWVLSSPRARMVLSAFDASSDSVVITLAHELAHHGQPIVYVNQAFTDETGFRPEDALGRSIEWLLPDGVDPEAIAWFTDVRDRPGSATREVVSRRADGSVFVSEITVSPMCDDRGVEMYWLYVRRDLTKRLAAEGDRARFQHLMDQTGSLVLLGETGGRWVYANAALRRALGIPLDMPVEQLDGRWWPEHLRRRLEQEILPNVMMAGAWSGEDTLVDNETGRRTDVLIEVQVFDDPLRPGVRVYAAVGTDVTEINRLSRAEERRRELSGFTAELAQRALDQGRDRFMSELDATLEALGRLIGADEVYLDEISREAGLLRPVASWQMRPRPGHVPVTVPLDDLPTWIAHLSDHGVVLSAQDPPDGERPWRDELARAFGWNGTGVHAYVALRVDGELYGVLGTAKLQPRHDWTDDELQTLQQVAETIANLLSRQRAAAELEATQHRHEAMLRNVSDVLVVLDSNGIVQYVNPAVLPKLGHDPADVCGRFFLDLVVPEDHALAIDSFGRALAGHESLPVTELRILRADGTAVWCDVDSSGVVDPAVGGIVVSLRDVSVQREALAVAGRRSVHEGLVVALSHWALEVESDDIDRGLAAHLEQLGKALAADAAFVALLDGDRVRNVAGWSAREQRDSYEFPAGDDRVPAIVARYRTLQPLVVADIFEHDEDWAIEWRRFPVPDRSGLNVPLVSEGRCLGNIGVSMEHEVRAWTADEIDLVQRCSAVVSALLARRQVEHALRREAEQAQQWNQLLREAFDLAQLALDLGSAEFLSRIDELCARVGRALGADSVYVDRLDEQRRLLCNLGGWAHTPTAVARGAISFDVVPHWIERLRRLDPIVVPDVHASGEPWVQETQVGLGDESAMVGIVMSSAGELLGVLGAAMIDCPRQWTADEVTFLRILGETVAHVLGRARVDEALRASESRFRSLSEAAADTVLLVDAAGRITYASPSSAELFGVPADTLIGRPTRDYEHPDDTEHGDMQLARLRETGRADFELRIRRGSGVVGEIAERRHPVVVRFLREPEDPLADDVLLDLVGPAVDRRGLCEQRHLGDDRRERVAGRLVERPAVLALVRVERALRAEDAEADVTGEAHDAAHRELRGVGLGAGAAPRRLGGLRAEVRVAGDLVERVEADEVLPDGRVVDGAVALRRGRRGASGWHRTCRRPHPRHRAGAGRRSGRSRRPASRGAPSRCPASPPMRRRGRRRRRARPLVREGRVRDGPAAVEATDDRVVGHAGIREEHLVEQRPPRELLERTNVDARAGACRWRSR